MHSKKHLATLLATTPGVMASMGSLLQFFRSPQYHPDEEHEGNHIEDFLTFRGYLDADLVGVKEFDISKTFLRDQSPNELKIPKKVQQKLDADHQKFQQEVKDWNELDFEK